MVSVFKLKYNIKYLIDLRWNLDFSNPLGKRKLHGSSYQEIRKIGGSITVFGGVRKPVLVRITGRLQLYTDILSYGPFVNWSYLLKQTLTFLPFYPFYLYCKHLICPPLQIKMN